MAISPLVRSSFIVSIAAASVLTQSGWPQAKASTGGPKPAVSRVLPSGEDVTQLDSINVTFNRKMVPLGRMERSKEGVAIDISPTVECSWIWISPETISCKVPEAKPLRQATRYRVVVRGDLKDSDGNSLGQPHTHSFVTQRPTVSWQNFSRWLSPSFPVIQVSFNMPVVAGSLPAALFFVGEGGEKIPVRAVNQKWAEESFYDGKKSSADIMRELFQLKNDDRAASQSWIIAPERELRADSHQKLQLVATALQADAGSERGALAKVLVEFDTYGPLAYMGVNCHLEDGTPDSEFVTDSSGTGKRREVPKSASQPCDPLSNINVMFSSPISMEEFDKNCFLTKVGSVQKIPDFSKNGYSQGRLQSSHTKGESHSVQLTPLTKAKTSFSIACSGKLRDLFGRSLGKDTSFEFALGSRKPRLDIGYNSGALEKTIDSDVPVYATNLKSAKVDYQILTADGGKGGLSRALPLQKVDDLSYAFPLGLREMLEGKSGAAFVSLSSPDTVVGPPLKGFFQVSPFQIHVKEGHFKSLVWVSDLKTGVPVKGAEVKIFLQDFRRIDQETPALVKGTTDENGLAWLPGFVNYDPKMAHSRYGMDEAHLIVAVKKGQDLGLVPLVSDYRAYGSGAWAHNRPEYGHLKVWGTTAQGVYRAGEKIDYKIYVRQQDERKLVPAPPNGYILVVKDPAGQEVFRREKVKLNEFGSLFGSFSTSKTAAVGWYEFVLSSNFLGTKDGDKFTSSQGEEGEGEGEVRGGAKLHAMQVLVTDFTPAPFRAENDIDRPIYEQGDTVQINTRAKLHSGGAYGDAKARVTAAILRSGFTSNDPLASQYNFSCGEGHNDTRDVFQKEFKLSAQGELKTSVKLDVPDVACGRLFVTSDIADDRGKYYSAVKESKFYSVSRFLGLRKDKYFYQEGEGAKIEFVVADMQGKPVKDVPAKLRLQRLDRKVVRVKGAGNAYLEEAKNEWVNAGNCEKMSLVKAQTCAFKTDKAGSYKILGSVSDPKGHENTMEEYFYVSGKGAVVWDDGSSNSLRIIPESNSPKVGEKARYLVQNPFPGAQALVTIERYGVIKAWTQKFETSSPVVEFEVDEDYQPGFFLSVTVFSPRVAQPLGEGNVDLGKPTFAMGYVQVIPENKVKEIEVKVVSDREVYKPRDSVKLTLQGNTKGATAKGGEVEYAVAVLDEAVFDLIQGGKNYFDLYKGLNHLNDLDVSNYDLLMQLIGRQKFEKKGANAGGDGGGFSARSLFKYVAYWNPSLKANKDGSAEAKFEVPDNLTGWIVLAMATTPGDRMGLGEGHFKVNRATEIRPVMPNVIFEGDDFKGAFTVMNRLEKPRTFKVSVSVEGDLANDQKPGVVFEKEVQAESFKRVLVDFDVRSSLLKEERMVEGGKLKFLVKAGDALDSDGLVHEVSIRKKRSFLTAASYSTTDGKSVEEKIEFPKNIFTDVGKVEVQVSPTVIGNLDGAFRYLWQYPYLCWEQRLTKGTMANSYLKLQTYLDPKTKWSDADSVTKQMLDDAASFQTPNGGMAYFRASDDYVSPYLSAFTALAFRWLKTRGETPPQVVSDKLDKYLLGLLKSSAFPTFYSKGMSSTVRAVALSALAKNKVVSSQDVERYRSHVADMDLFGQAHFLLAALEFSDREATAKETLQGILGRANESAGKFRFTETLDYGWTRIHSSETRTQCAVLSAIAKAAETPWGAQLVGDVPFKLVRFITQSRGKKDRWENTQENLFCSEALVDYSRRFESEKPAMKVLASLNGKNFGDGSLEDFRAKPLVFRRDISAGDAGTAATVKISKDGKGRFYGITSLRYAPKESFSELKNAGIEIRREYNVERNGKMQLLKSPFQVKQGELVRVDLYLNLPSARNFVVVDDPLPGGLEALNSDLATTSNVDAAKAKPKIAEASFFWNFKDWMYYGAGYWSFYLQEVRYDSVRFYSEYLDKGHYYLSYVAQAIARGHFAVPPSHAEEMYDPDVYGKSTEGTLEVSAP